MDGVYFERVLQKNSSERINGNLFAELGTFPANNSVILFHTYGISSIADRLSKPSALIANYMRCFHKVSNSGLNFFSRDPSIWGTLYGYYRLMEIHHTKKIVLFETVCLKITYWFQNIHYFFHQTHCYCELKYRVHYFYIFTVYVYFSKLYYIHLLCVCHFFINYALIF